MSHADDDEPPLDPAVERVRKKLARLLFVSSGVMVLGFAAVAMAVVYRISADRAPAEASRVTLDLGLDDLRGIAMGDETIAFTVAGDPPRVEIRRIADGALVQTFELSR